MSPPSTLGWGILSPATISSGNSKTTIQFKPLVFHALLVNLDLQPTAAGMRRF